MSRALSGCCKDPAIPAAGFTLTLTADTKWIPAMPTHCEPSGVCCLAANGRISKRRPADQLCNLNPEAAFLCFLPVFCIRLCRQRRIEQVVGGDSPPTVRHLRLGTVSTANSNSCKFCSDASPQRLPCWKSGIIAGRERYISIISGASAWFACNLVFPGRAVATSEQ